MSRSERAIIQEVQFGEAAPADQVIIIDEYHSLDPMLSHFSEGDGDSATPLTHWGAPLKKVLVSFAVAASLAGPMQVPEVRRRYQASALTQLVDMSWRIEEWEPLPQLITNEQVRSLNALLSLPYAPGDITHLLVDE